MKEIICCEHTSRRRYGFMS